MLWTSERDDRVIVLWAKGLSASEIARELGDCSRNAIIGRVYRLRADGRPLDARSKAPPRHRKSPSKFRAARSRPPKPPPPELTLPSPDKLIPFLDVRNGLCRWPHGDPHEFAAFRFCGEQTHDAHVYCDYHCAFARQSTQSISADERDRRRYRALRLNPKRETQAGNSS